MSPNIVLLLVDDLGWRDLTCYGSSFYETPNIDRLAQQGMLFTDAYAASPVCSPTRASLLTGKYPARIGITNFISKNPARRPDRGRLVDATFLRQLPEAEPTVASLLQDRGYVTWHVGKWHLGGPGHLPTEHGFDVNIGGGAEGGPGAGGYFSPWTIEGLADAEVPKGTYLTDHLTDRAIGLIDEHGRSGDGAPFFLNLWYYAVHTPIQAKADTITKYEAKARELGLDAQAVFVEGEAFPTRRRKEQRVLRRVVQSDPAYAAMIEHLDDNVGRLVNHLDAAGLGDDTVILLTSDNGGLATADGSPTSNRPLAEGKGWMYEGGTREPLIVRWPDVIEAGSSCAAPVTSPDFLPTLLEIAKKPIDDDGSLDGVSFLPLLGGGEAAERDGLFWHYPHYGNQGGTPGSSIRVGDHKLIEFFEDGHLELYDLRSDVAEENNLVDQRPEIARDLKARLAAWRRSLDAQIPRVNQKWWR